MVLSIPSKVEVRKTTVTIIMNSISFGRKCIGLKLQEKGVRFSTGDVVLIPPEVGHTML